MSLGTPSDITKVSGSSLMYNVFKIPRAHPTSTSDSGTAETLPSDYPSESPSSGSEVEEVDVHQPSEASSNEREELVQAFENHAFEVEEERLSSVYSDAFVQSEAEMIASPQVIRPPKPTFMVRVKRAPTPPRTPEPDYPVQLAQAQSLTTIDERDESFRAESIPGSEHALLVSEPEDLLPPAQLHPPPQYSQVQRKTQEIVRAAPSEYGSEGRSLSEHQIELERAIAARREMKHIENVETIVRTTTDVEEIVDRGIHRYIIPPPPSEPDSDYPSEARSVTDVVEELSVVPRQPQLTTHTVDDRVISTVTETTTTEDVEKHRRYIKQVSSYSNLIAFSSIIIH